MKNKYTKEIMLKAVEGSYSIADICKKLNLVSKGGNYHTVRKKCEEFNIDISHLTGQAWKRNPNKNKYNIKLEDILLENVLFKSSNLRKRLINLGLKENKCEICGCTLWMDKPLTLELHHINSNHFDNRLENLQILCPNCHSLQLSHRNPKINHSKSNTVLNQYREELKKCTCMYCGKEFKSDRYDRTRKFCSRECYNLFLLVNRVNELRQGLSFNSLPIDDLKKEIQNCNTITEMAKNLKLNRGTVKEYLIKYSLYDEFKTKCEENKINKDILNNLLSKKLELKTWKAVSEYFKVTPKILDRYRKKLKKNI